MQKFEYESVCKSSKRCLVSFRWDMLEIKIYGIYQLLGFNGNF